VPEMGVFPNPPTLLCLNQTYRVLTSSASTSSSRRRSRHRTNSVCRYCRRQRHRRHRRRRSCLKTKHFVSGCWRTRLTGPVRQHNLFHKGLRCRSALLLYFLGKRILDRVADRLLRVPRYRIVGPASARGQVIVLPANSGTIGFDAID